MNTPILVWLTIISIVAVIITIHVIRISLIVFKGKHRWIRYGSEREELFIPGDPLPDRKIDYDYEDADDF